MAKKSSSRKKKADAVAVDETTAESVGSPAPEAGDIEVAVEVETQLIGEWLFSHTRHRKPSIFERRWWDDRLLSWAMEDEAIKVQMFRFIDVLPMLKTHDQIARHLQEYFEEVNSHLPGAAQLVLDHSGPNTVLGRALAYNARSNARRMAERFISGQSADDVLKTVTALRKQGFAFTLDLLGEAVISDSEANAYKTAYQELMTNLAEPVNGWSEDPTIDYDDRGPMARLNVSIKLSALCSQFRPIDPVGTSEAVKTRLRPILRRAQKSQAHVHVDMEQYAYKDLTLSIFKEVLLEDEFRKWGDAGIVIQAYLPDSERDLLALREWVEQRGTPITVRLVKGAYWDYETVMAEQRGWPVPVYQQKWQSDDSFERLSRFLMENYRSLRPAFASHNLRSLAHAIAWGRKLGVPQAAYEIQMLYGMATDHAQLFRELGHRVRIYTPFGELLSGMAYLVRRLLENTSNESFLRHSLAEDISREKLMAKPSSRAASLSVPPQSEVVPETPPVFVNEPCSDFGLDSVREQMQAALTQVTAELGKTHSLIIDGRSEPSRSVMVSLNPSLKTQVVGKIGLASAEDAYKAIAVAKRVFSQWSKTELSTRVEHLNRLAKHLQAQRFQVAAWEVFECGKTWIEADADVAEAIDFCRYYAQQAAEFLEPRAVNISGEENTYFYKPRGVCAVIAPWNFPLAILCGMTAAALVTGNTVVLKPSEQASIVAAKFMRIMEAAGIPNGVINLLPGVGDVVGPPLVNSPDVAVIAFTGSREVGLEINRLAAITDPRQPGVKKVVAEMGGKNAILIDNDADMDEAIQGVVQSAFSFSGQKCSACSRVIVHKDIYTAFVKRLVAAVKSLKVGPANDPSSFMGPVIDADAVTRIQKHIALGKTEARLVLEGSLDETLANSGYYVAPHIFIDVPPTSRLAQEEIFGPVLAVIPAKDLSEAISIANGTDYALTVGVFSRSPANLKRCCKELLAGNVYLNRGITGALVNRQPFGGFKFSGIGTKAGGPDYLSQFVIPVNITENTMRRGFAPQE